MDKSWDETLNNLDKAKPGELEIDLDAVPVKVEAVKLDGLSRTHNDYVQKAIQHIFLAKNFGELVYSIGLAQQKLRSLDVFSEVGTLVDTNKADNASSDGYAVTFILKEMSKFTGSIQTAIGANEGTMTLGLKFPNLFGHGERVSLDHVLSTLYDKNSELSYNKPFPFFMDSSFRTSVFYTRTPNTFSGYNNTSVGTGFSYNFKPFHKTLCQTQWQGVWRNLQAIGSQASLPVREQCGNSVKSSLKFIFNLDHRNDLIFPSKGSLLKVTSEFAGLSGDAHFVRNDVEVQCNKALPFGTVLQTSIRGGLLIPFSPSTTDCNISDFFFLGGPQSLRGFEMKGVGPHKGSNALGGKVYWSFGVHLYSPLPYFAKRLSIADYVRAHTFVNIGSLSNSLSSKDVYDPKVSCGVGLAVRMASFARVEVNYCVPLRYNSKDRPVNGIQVGLGVDFL